MDNLLISPKETKERLNSGPNGFMLVDIRESDEYSDWNIPGSVNLPVNDLIAKGNYPEIRQKLAELPKNKQIITVCAKGLNSQVAASILRDMGYDSLSLEKGMKGWNENFDIYKVDFNDFEIIQFVRIGKGCLSYIIYDKSTGEAALIEPSVFIGEYEDYIRSNNLNLKYIIDTHAHADHFSGGIELGKKLNIGYYINEIETDSGFEFKSLKGIRELSLGRVKIEFLQTPGHTDGSLSLLVNNEALLCGDLLLLESPGRPDLARTKNESLTGAGILFDTLQELKGKINDSVIIFPSHFTKTEKRPVCMSFGELKSSLKALNITDKLEFIDHITESIPKTPPNFETIKKYNKAGVIIPLDYAEDLEIGPNRCGVR